VSDPVSLLVAHRPVNDLAKKEPRRKVGCEPMNEAASSELSLAVTVARRYYLRDESKVDIARFLGVSRFKVARLLSLARSSGLVHVEIREPREAPDSVAAQLRLRYQLTECHAVPGGRDEGVTRAIGEVAASLLERIVSTDDMLGLPWARTVHHAVRSLQQLPRVPVVQLSGSMISPNESTPFDLVRYAATVSGGEGYFFQAPMIMPSADGADAVRQHEDVMRAMEAVGSVTIALCSIGSWSPGTSTIFDRLSEQDRESAREAGVVGETMGILFGEDGRPVSPNLALAQRMITISFEQLQAIPVVVAMSHGIVRLAATRALLRSGVVDYLVIDDELAHALLVDSPMLVETTGSQRRVDPEMR
jgi:DNA-binding transcriptional regulator LsrR (DeoR family)